MPPTAQRSRLLGQPHIPKLRKVPKGGGRNPPPSRVARAPTPSSTHGCETRRGRRVVLRLLAWVTSLGRRPRDAVQPSNGPSRGA